MHYSVHRPMKTRRGSFCLVLLGMRKPTRILPVAIHSLRSGLGLPGSSSFFRGVGGAEKPPCALRQIHPWHHQGSHLRCPPAPTFLLTSVQRRGGPRTPSFGSGWRGKAPAAPWFPLISVWSHYQTHFALHRRKDPTIRHLYTKVEITSTYNVRS